MGSACFAHYSGVSRTLETYGADTVKATRQALEAFSHPLIRTAVVECLHADQPLVYNVDLMGQAVSPIATVPSKSRLEIDLRIKTDVIVPDLVYCLRVAQPTKA